MTSPSAIRDPRLTAARPDLAAASLQGLVSAARYVEGHHRRILDEVVDLKRRPRPDAPLDTQLLFGEIVVVYDEDDEGWAWVQAQRDGYVGYTPAHALGHVVHAPTHRVAVNRTFLYPAADMKQPVRAAAPLDGRVVVVGGEGDFVKTGDGFIFAAHLTPIAHPAPDFVTVAEQLIGAPYLWGGKSAGGVDCSGLVQLAMAVANRPIPRDTDMQERLGTSLPLDPALRHLQRGDLVFWKGHVGIMVDPERLLHANGHHMLVMLEPLRAAQQRIENTTGLPISSARRLLD